MADISVKDRMVGGLLGLVVGDALGVPVEFQSRSARDRNPVTGMVGFGTHGQPPGTWSDDSSLALATAESLLSGYDPADIMRRFSCWRSEGYMTARGEVFDIGNTTAAAISRYDRGKPPETWGGCGEHSNGNGSLMRILPLSLFVRARPAREIVRLSGEVGALTHGHMRSQLCCGYYSLLVRELLAGRPLPEAMSATAGDLVPHQPSTEAEHFHPLMGGEVLDWPRDRVESSGYVIHTLEASVWCVGRHECFPSAVLAAVNLGDDTDTTGAVTGGLAGVIYGRAAIPADWLDAIAEKNEVVALAEALADRCESEGGVA